MSTEVQQPVQENPAGPISGPGNVDSTATTAPATETPILGPGEAKPSEKGTAEAVPTLTNKPKEEKLENEEVLIESHPINEGVLTLKGPGLKGLIPSKKYFWFSDGPLEHKNLSAYISNEKSKDVAHGNAAHATQTGKGLLFYAKRAEDKDHPQGILNLADMSDLSQGNFNDFSISLHGHKYTLQATNKAERDGWLVAIDPKLADAKTAREGIVGSEGYKNQLEKYGKPAAVAGTKSKTRSLSRPNKDKASKSRERTAAAATTKEATPVKDTKVETVTGTTPTATSTTSPTTADTTTEANPTTANSETHQGTTGEHVAEAAADAAAGGAVVGASARKNSASDEEKKNKKSRSQSRGNKRSSLFGGLLSKKEENDDKKAIKKAEKEEEKKEEKAIANEVKKEEKAEKQDEKAEHKAEKVGEKEAGEFDAAAVASRVIGEPVIPATGLATEISPVTVTEPATASTTADTTPTLTTKDTAAKPNKRNSVFGGLFGKKESSASPVTAETSPAVPAKDEPAPVSSTAPQLDNPVTEPTTEIAVPTTDAAKTETTPAADTVSPVTAPTSATTPTDKRRTSFFGGLGTKKEKKTGATSGDELTDSETKKQGGGFSGLLRKASRAQPKKDSKIPVTDPAAVPLPKEGAKGEKAIKDGEQPPTNVETPATTEGQKIEQKPELAEGEVGSNAMAKSEAPVVQATA